MIENKLSFLKSNFSGLKIQFADDFSHAVIFNPFYGENIMVYDDEFEFTVCFSFYHCHLDDEEEAVKCIREIITENKFAIAFFHNGQTSFVMEIEAEELQDLSYEKFERISGYFGLTKLSKIVDSFKVRAWDNRHNIDATFVRDSDGCISIKESE